MKYFKLLLLLLFYCNVFSQLKTSDFEHSDYIHHYENNIIEVYTKIEVKNELFKRTNPDDIEVFVINYHTKDSARLYNDSIS